MAERYYNFKLGLNSKPKLLTLEEIQKLKINENQDAYLSIYYYNEEQKRTAEKNGSVASISNVVTDTLVFDFDSKDNPEKAKKDTLELGRRLVEEYNVDPDVIFCYYSGKKGYHVAVPLDKEITPEQFKQATVTLSNGLETFDASVSDHARILRMEHTKHQDTGLYKIPLHLAELEELSVEQIRAMSKKDRSENEAGLKAGSAMLPERLFKVTEKKKELKVVTDDEFDYSKPPKGWKTYKWALAQGHFSSGERHNALMVIAATCRSLGYDKDSTYYICKSALKKQSRRTNDDEFNKEELWQNIIEESVFSDRWEGGAYSPQNNPWLAKYCERMGFDASEKKDAPVIELNDLIDNFISYSTNFEQNLIKTGIEGLDRNLTLSTSTLNGILGQPGSGKTTVAIEILKNASINNIPSMFFSLDMGPPLVFSKLVQKETGVDFKSALKMYREATKHRDDISKIIKEKYRNVGFNFRCGLTVADIKNNIHEQSERTGIKPKLVVIDYLENIAGPYSDPTANAAMICNQLKDLATEEEVCILLLLQTQKHSTPDISDPLLSMKQIKGSSVIEQSCSVILTLWREGYNPDHVDDDRYISFAIVKNRFGPMWKGDFSWDAIKGHIRSLSEEEHTELEEFKKRKKQERANAAKEKEDWT